MLYRQNLHLIFPSPRYQKLHNNWFCLPQLYCNPGDASLLETFQPRFTKVEQLCTTPPLGSLTKKKNSLVNFPFRCKQICQRTKYDSTRQSANCSVLSAAELVNFYYYVNIRAVHSLFCLVMQGLNYVRNEEWARRGVCVYISGCCWSLQI